MFGRSVGLDWDIRDGLDPATSKIVARGRGSAMGDSMTTHGYFLSLDILFTDERFKGSTLKVLGSYDNTEEAGADHLAIVGGTGEFEYAQGTISYKPLMLSAVQIIREVNIRVFCRNVPPPTPLVKKEGPLGGPGGANFDIPAGALPPQRIKSITIRSDGAINSLAYSYIDQAGNEQTSGPWGGSGGFLRTTINFPEGETLKKVIGTTAIFDKIQIVTSLTFITNSPMFSATFSRFTSVSRRVRHCRRSKTCSKPVRVHHNGDTFQAKPLLGEGYSGTVATTRR
ncbi:hypothetical protein QYE76_016177 [Lolium multiflorum]|uniref:Dirigent protein n=1 Tax=Lolium multiflorum TaxID=4521 RepID=A0AAD8U8A6_LOLMU|nr:hypothetical protein QYE76_016115 [Lolium multiflorum]KAK1699480.1 hypothetical protein QYE76_016177 [Lolium multiflorum]